MNAHETNIVASTRRKAAPYRPTSRLSPPERKLISTWSTFTSTVSSSVATPIGAPALISGHQRLRSSARRGRTTKRRSTQAAVRKPTSDPPRKTIDTSRSPPPASSTAMPAPAVSTRCRIREIDTSSMRSYAWRTEYQVRPRFSIITPAPIRYTAARTSAE